MALPLLGGESPAGEAQSLATLDIDPSPGFPGSPVVFFENGLALQRLDWFDESVHPGHNMSVALIWQTEPGTELEMGSLRYELAVVSPNGDVVRTLGGKPLDGGLDVLPQNTAAREPAAFYFPPESKPGEYTLWWQLYEDDELVRSRPSWRPWYSDRSIAGRLVVAPWPMQTELPEDIVVTEVQFGPAIQLYGYEIQDAAPGSLPVTLYWLAEDEPDESYLVFAHLVDADTGEIKSQVDRVPVGDLRPTSGWREGEVLTDRLSLPLPDDVQPGDYRINVGMYNPDNGQRLPLEMNGQRIENDQLPLEDVTIP
jgi:hypothetical protein